MPAPKANTTKAKAKPMTLREELIAANLYTGPLFVKCDPPRPSLSPFLPSTSSLRHPKHRVPDRRRRPAPPAGTTASCAGCVRRTTAEPLDGRLPAQHDDQPVLPEGGGRQVPRLDPAPPDVPPAKWTGVAQRGDGRQQQVRKEDPGARTESFRARADDRYELRVSLCARRCTRRVALRRSSGVVSDATDRCQEGETS